MEIQSDASTAKTLSKSDWQFNTHSRILKADWLIMKLNLLLLALERLENILTKHTKEELLSVTSGRVCNLTRVTSLLRQTDRTTSTADPDLTVSWSDKASQVMVLFLQSKMTHTHMILVHMAYFWYSYPPCKDIEKERSNLFRRNGLFS